MARRTLMNIGAVIAANRDKPFQHPWQAIIFALLGCASTTEFSDHCRCARSKLDTSMTFASSSASRTYLYPGGRTTERALDWPM
jgi:hypothetical protein